MGYQYKRSRYGTRRAMYRPMYRGSIYDALRLGTAVAQRYRSSGSRTQTQTKKRTTSGVGITTQHDVKRIYRKKTMPRRKKRAWKKFISKVNAVDETDLGSQTVLFSNATSSSATSDVQIVIAFGLYTAQSGTSWNADLNQISGLFNVGNPTAAGDDYVNSTSKIIFKSAVLDMTIRNTSDNGSGAAVDIPLEVDVYEMTVSRGEDDSTILISNLQDYFTQAATDTLNIGGTVAGAGGNLVLASRGCTPWELPAAMSNYGIKILKKTKYFITTGQSFTIQMRDPRRHVTTFSRITRVEGPNMNGLTRWFMFIAKAVPGVTLSPTNVAKLSFGVTRKYLCKVEGMRTDRDYYIKV